MGALQINVMRPSYDRAGRVRASALSCTSAAGRAEKEIRRARDRGVERRGFAERAAPRACGWPTGRQDGAAAGGGFSHACAACASATVMAKQRADLKAQVASLVELGMGRRGATLTTVVDGLAAQHSKSASTLKPIWRRVEHAPQPARAWVLTPGWRAGEGDWNAAELTFFDHVKAQMDRSRPSRMA